MKFCDQYLFLFFSEIVVCSWCRMVPQLTLLEQQCSSCKVKGYLSCHGLRNLRILTQLKMCRGCLFGKFMQTSQKPFWSLGSFGIGLLQNGTELPNGSSVTSFCLGDNFAKPLFEQTEVIPDTDNFVNLSLHPFIRYYSFIDRILPSNEI